MVAGPSEADQPLVGAIRGAEELIDLGAGVTESLFRGGPGLPPVGVSLTAVDDDDVDVVDGLPVRLSCERSGDEDLIDPVESLEGALEDVTSAARFLHRCRVGIHIGLIAAKRIVGVH